MTIRCESCGREQTLAPDGIAERCCGKPRPVRVASSKAKPSPIQQTSPVEPRTRYRSKTEAAYADHLDVLLRAGEIVDWKYEAIKLRLPGGYFYVPDFVVVLPGGGFELREVKGAKRGRYYSREVGKMKARIAAETYSFLTLCIVWPLGNGAWRREDQ